MDLLNSRTINIATLALDGLSQRHKAISSNVANADTPGYKRVDVSFEDQLERIINTEDIKEAEKLMNSIALTANTSNASNENFTPQVYMPLTVNRNQALMEVSDFEPQMFESDDNSPDNKDNTVNIEQEMSSLTKNGMTYNALATLQAKAFRGLAEVIRGSSSMM